MRRGEGAILRQFAEHARRLATALRLTDGPDLLVAPQDLRTADPTIASDILAGRFVFAGKLVSVPPGRSPFVVAAPSPEWAAALHGFDWLRHLRGANTAAARAIARALFEDWLTLDRRRAAVAWQPTIVTRRLLALLAHSPLLLEDADTAFYGRLIRSIQAHVAVLAGARLPPGLDRLVAAVAMVQAALCLDGTSKAADRATKRLIRELETQILPDGGHVSRAPHVLPEILAELLPLRQVYLTRTAGPPDALNRAIDRIMPMLRLFRHGDGAFGLFNGSGPVPSDLVATLLAYDDARGAAPTQAPDMGYQRLEAGTFVALVDTGTAPPKPFAGDAHAGALALELSDGPQRLFVNCGRPAFAGGPWRAVARATAAHSTLILADTSSSRFGAEGRGAPLLPGPKQISVAREVIDSGVILTATHDGYAAKFRAVHERKVFLGTNGIAGGTDRLLPTNAKRPMPDEPVAVRFHLHPSVRASVVRGGAAILLQCPGRGTWEFTADGGTLSLEESVFLAATEGPRRTDQIVISGRSTAETVFRWQLTRKSTV